MRIVGFNLATGEITDRDMTEDEIADLESLPVYDIPQMDWETVMNLAPVEEAQPSTDAG